MVNATPRPLYPLERPGTHCTGGWVGLRAGLDRCGKSALTGIRSPGRPAHNKSLYRLSYPGSQYWNKTKQKTLIESFVLVQKWSLNFAQNSDMKTFWRLNLESANTELSPWWLVDRAAQYNLGWSPTWCTKFLFIYNIMGQGKALYNGKSLDGWMNELT